MGDELNESPNHVMGGIAGGAVIGILSVIPCLNLCCMLWGIVGGVLAAYIAAQRPRLYGIGDGALSGVCAAGAGWLLHTIINVPLQLLMANLMPRQAPPPNVPPEIAQFLQPGNPVALLLGQVVILFIFLATAAIGGLIGGAMFKKEDKDLM